MNWRVVWLRPSFRGPKNHAQSFKNAVTANSKDKRRKPMKTGMGSLAATLMLSGTLAANAQQVTVQGCPVAGAVAGCVMIRGVDNVTYNISESKPWPEFANRAIRLTGVRSNKTSYCAQGVVLTNITWSYTDRQCK